MPIIGNGSIASLLNNREGVRFFASGVSDSSFDGNVASVGREALMIGVHSGLANAYKEMFVYFSTISVFMQQTPYTKHKLTMETCVRNNCNNYAIIRLGNIWECTNPNTFINKMKYWIRQEKLLKSMIRDEYKYMISKQQLNFITDNLPLTGKHEISIFGEMLKVKECLNR
jgi:hypothetical protein